MATPELSPLAIPASVTALQRSPAELLRANSGIATLDEDAAITPLNLAPDFNSRSGGGGGTRRSSLSPIKEPVYRPPAEGVRFVTASAILSRTGAVYPLETPDPDIEGEEADTQDLDLFFRRRQQQQQQHHHRQAPRSRPSNGSALEALSALLLRTDASGKVSSLSSVRNRENLAKTPGAEQEDDVLHTGRIAAKWSRQLQWLQDQAAETMIRRLRMPGGAESRDSGEAAAPTIAERRAQSRSSLVERIRQMRYYTEAEEVEEDADGEKRWYKRVGTRRNMPSFQVAQSISSNSSSGQASPRAISPPRSKPDFRRAQSENGRIYGRGSAPPLPGGRALPDAPPSPVAMPGAWLGGHAWRARPGDGFEEGALLLPPPLLDDKSSDPKAFEGERQSRKSLSPYSPPLLDSRQACWVYEGRGDKNKRGNAWNACAHGTGRLTKSA